MCHLCRKSETIHTLNSPLTNPVVALLSQLHNRTKHRLADYWTIRLEHMLQLQVLLQKLPQVGIVKGFSKDVEIEILHVKKSLAEHPVAEDRWLSRLSESIAPGDSISEAGRKKRAEAGDKERNNVSGDEDVARAKPEIEPPLGKYESDIDPPLEVVLQSIGKVEAWLNDWDHEFLEFEWQGVSNLSAASLVEGSLEERLGLRSGISRKIANRKKHAYAKQRPAGPSSESSSTDRDQSGDLSPISSTRQDNPMSSFSPRPEGDRHLLNITGTCKKKAFKRTQTPAPQDETGKTGILRSFSVNRAIQAVREKLVNTKSKTKGSEASNIAESSRRLATSSKNRPGETKTLYQMYRDSEDFDGWTTDTGTSYAESSRSSTANSESLVRHPPGSRSRSSVQYSSRDKSGQTGNQDVFPTNPAKAPVLVGLPPSRPSMHTTGARDTLNLHNIDESGSSRFKGHIRSWRIPVSSSDAGVGVGLSKAIMESRRRRTERASRGVPFTDRYRNGERQKLWGPKR